MDAFKTISKSDGETVIRSEAEPLLRHIHHNGVQLYNLHSDIGHKVPQKLWQASATESHQENRQRDVWTERSQAKLNNHLQKSLLIILVRLSTDQPLFCGAPTPSMVSPATITSWWAQQRKPLSTDREAGDVAGAAAGLFFFLVFFF